MSGTRLYDHFDNGKFVSYEKEVLALLQQCKDEGLTVAQSKFVLRTAIDCIDIAISRSPVMF